MNTNLTIRRFLAISLSVCLLLPGTALAGNKGKKNFKEGQKHEAAQQWDLAAQQYALAVAADSNNAEYKLNYLRALQQASLMFIKRGDALNEQGDYASAYSAYRTAFQYDPSNEIAGIKMQRMLDQQKAQVSGHEPVNTTTTANVRPTADIQFAGKPRSRETIQNNISFTRGAKFKTVMNTLGKQLGLNVVFDDTVKDDEVVVDLTDVSLAKAFDIILLMKKHTFEQIDRRTIIIYPDNQQNKPRYEKLMIKTFYTGNISADQARQVLTPLIGPARQMAVLGAGAAGGAAGGASGSNTLIVKATAQELQLVQDVLDSIDKNKNEVVLDVEIYEVSHNSLLQIGNQIATATANYVDDVKGSDGSVTTAGVAAPTLSKLGGVGGNFSPTNAGYGIQLFNQTAGFLIGLPPTSLTFLQEKGDSKLLNKTQIHVLDGGQNTTKVGRSVPVRVGSQFGFGGGGFGGIGGIGGIGGVNQGTGGVIPGSGVNNGGLGGGLGGFLGGFGGYPGVDAIQYRDVGLVIKTKPMITNEGYVEIQMDFETSDVVTGANPLNPEFTQRSLNTTARIKDGVTAVVAGVSQDQRGNSRSGVPVLSMVPILGRLFSAPRQDSRKSDIVITVTPHVVRSAGIESKDHLAKEAGVQPQGQGSSLAPKIEDVIYRAQQEEEQERRLIAGNAPPPAAAPLVPDAQVTSNQPGQPGVNPAPTSNPQQIVNASNATSAPAARPLNNSSPAARSLNNASLTNSGINTASPSQPSQPAPAAPQQAAPQQAAPQPASSVAPGPTGEGAPPPKNDAALSPELEQALKEFQAQNANPETPVPQAIPMASRPSEAYIKQMAEWKRKAQTEASAPTSKAPQAASAPAQMPKEMMTPSGPTQKVAPAVPSAVGAAGARGNQVTFNLSPRPINQQVGKSFTVNVEVNSQAQMTGADVTFKYDASKLQVKSVRDGGLLGAQPELNYELKDKGTLLVHINHARKTPVAASGQLIVIEFTALAEGYSQIAVNPGETKVKLPGNINATAGSASTQVNISRNGVTSATNEK